MTQRDYCVVFLWAIEAVFAFCFVLAFGIFVLPFHATGSHANRTSDLWSLSELLVGSVSLALSLAGFRDKTRSAHFFQPWIAALLLGAGLGLIVSVVYGNWPDISGNSR